MQFIEMLNLQEIRVFVVVGAVLALLLVVCFVRCLCRRRRRYRHKKRSNSLSQSKRKPKETVIPPPIKKVARTRSKSSSIKRPGKQKKHLLSKTSSNIISLMSLTDDKSISCEHQPNDNFGEMLKMRNKVKGKRVTALSNRSVLSPTIKKKMKSTINEKTVKCIVKSIKVLSIEFPIDTKSQEFVSILNKIPKRIPKQTPQAHQLYLPPKPSSSMRTSTMSLTYESLTGIQKKPDKRKKDGSVTALFEGVVMD
jgi:hypothetical protein